MEWAEFNVLLHRRGMRVTPQRVAVMDAVSGNGSHPSAEEVYEEVRERIPSISLATVYKVLGELRDLGQLRELPVSGKLRFDADVGPHHHLVCDRCRRVEDVRRDGASPAPKLPSAAAGGFRILGAEVIFRGLCPGCREPSEEARRRNRGGPPRGPAARRASQTAKERR